MNRRHRLRGRAAFAAVRARRASASASLLRVGVAPNEAGVARVGYAIPRQVGNAVVRNRLRRRLRAALLPRLDDLAGLDVVVNARPGAAGAAWTALDGDLAQALRGARDRLARSAARS